MGIGLELGAQLEFLIFFVKLLSTLPAFLFRGLDAILGKLIDSAGLIPLLKIMCFRDFISNDTQNTEHPGIVPVVKYSNFRFNIFNWKAT